MSVLGQESESGLVVTEDWPGYERYYEPVEAQVRETEPAVPESTEAKETTGYAPGKSIFANPLVWLAIILVIGGEALFSREEKEPWER